MNNLADYLAYIRGVIASASLKPVLPGTDIDAFMGISEALSPRPH